MNHLHAHDTILISLFFLLIPLVLKAQNHNHSDSLEVSAGKIQAFMKWWEQQPKPEVIPDGWHLCKVIIEEAELKDQQFRVQNNQIVETVREVYPRYEIIQPAYSGAISMGKVAGELEAEEGDIYALIYFDEFTKNPDFRGGGPMQDERSKWWFEDLPESVRGLIAQGHSGENDEFKIRGSAMTDFEEIYFDPEHPTEEDFNQIENISKIIINTYHWSNFRNCGEYWVEKLRHSHFRSLQNAPVVLSYSPEKSHLYFRFQLTLGKEPMNDIQRYTAMSLSDLNHELSNESLYWKRALSGDFLPNKGFFAKGEPVSINWYPVVLTGNNLKKYDLEKIDSLVLDPETTVSLAYFKNQNKFPTKFIPNLEVINFSGIEDLDYQFFLQAIDNFPVLNSVKTVIACNTPAAEYGEKVLRKKRRHETLFNRLKTRFPNIQTVLFDCQNSSLNE